VLRKALCPCVSIGGSGSRQDGGGSSSSRECSQDASGMFAIAGKMRLPSYSSTKYEPLQLLCETPSPQEVRSWLREYWERGLAGVGVKSGWGGWLSEREFG
jgi:hypothetical protein